MDKSKPPGPPDAPAPDARDADEFLGKSRFDDASVGQHMVRGSAWVIAWRWGIRSIGLVSTIILARLLTPADFGLVAMAMVVVAFIEVFGETGQAMALIRIQNPTRDHYNTAFTLGVITGFVLAAVMVLVAPLGAAYFGEPKVQTLIYVLALRALLNGFENIGVVSFRANLDFSKDFQFGIYQKLGTFVIVVGLAIILRNYWALVIAIVAGRLFSTAISYVMHPFRPRFSLSKTRDIFSFSFWILAIQISNFLSAKADEFVVGGIAGTTKMGNYAVASDTAAAPTIELVVPITRALFPIYSKFADQPERLRDAYLDVLSVIAILSLSTAVGVALVAKDFAAVVLGPQWDATVPLIVWLALGGAAIGLADGVLTIFNVSNRASFSAAAVGVRVFLLIPMVALAGWLWGIEAVAIARAAVYGLMVPALFVSLTYLLPVTIGDIWARLWRPIMASLAMTLAVKSLHVEAMPSAMLRLLLDAAIGAAVFGAVLLILWRLAGRPGGAEQTIVSYIGRFWQRLRRRQASA